MYGPGRSWAGEAPDKALFNNTLRKEVGAGKERVAFRGTLLYTVPFQLPGIRPREVAVAVAFTLVLVSVGTLLGPLVTGYLNEAFDNWSTPLLIASFGGLTASASGFLLRLRGTTPAPARASS